ncbi:MAG: hypothetical protein LKK00_05245 [Intestinimonas sp.]|jgi:hypothetical protein|nr:hypothetical protein [Intestinimonas sp.]
MKTARFVLKIIALSLAFAAAVCGIIAYWDKLADTLSGLKEKGRDHGICYRPSEYDDYADLDE